MKLEIFQLSSLVLLVGYVYTLITAHFTLVVIDKKIRVPRRPSGEIKIKDLKELFSNSDVCEGEIKKAIFFLKLNNYLVFLYTGMVIVFIVATKMYC